MKLGFHKKIKKKTKAMKRGVCHGPEREICLLRVVRMQYIKCIPIVSKKFKDRIKPTSEKEKCHFILGRNYCR